MLDVYPWAKPDAKGLTTYLGKLSSQGKTPGCRSLQETLNRRAAVAYRCFEIIDKGVSSQER